MPGISSFKPPWVIAIALGLVCALSLAAVPLDRAFDVIHVDLIAWAPLELQVVEVLEGRERPTELVTSLDLWRASHRLDGAC